MSAAQKFMALPGILHRRFSLIRQTTRSVFGWGHTPQDPLSEFRSLVRDMERAFLRDTGHSWKFPHALPLSASHKTGNVYKLDLDMSAFKPEDIKVSLKNRLLTIHAKGEKKSEDGSRFYQEISREYLLPEKLKLEELRSLLDDDGILHIQGALQEPEKPRIIAIESDDTSKQDNTKPMP